MTEVWRTLFEKRYILVPMGSGITGDNLDVESELMLQKLTKNCTKTPNPGLCETIDLTLKAREEVLWPVRGRLYRIL